MSLFSAVTFERTQGSQMFTQDQSPSTSAWHTTLPHFKIWVLISYCSSETFLHQAAPSLPLNIRIPVCGMDITNPNSNEGGNSFRGLRNTSGRERLKHQVCSPEGVSEHGHILRCWSGLSKASNTKSMMGIQEQKGHRCLWHPKLATCHSPLLSPALLHSVLYSSHTPVSLTDWFEVR